jgi:NAD(P)H-nitrite reductase large subunit
MLKLGEKGVIPQNQEDSYAIAPHIPCGFITPELLRKIADVSEKYNAKAVKITGAARIAIIGLKENDIDSVWEELGLEKGAAVGLCVRSIRTCPGTSFCKLGKQDAVGIGMAMDKKYHALELPGKFKMAVSGCKLSCAESWVRDIGLIGDRDGWILTIGGNVGSQPRIGKELINSLDDAAALKAVEDVVNYYKDNAKGSERLGKMIERVGLEPFLEAITATR